MQSAPRAKSIPVRHLWWCLPLMLGSVLLRPNARLQAASNTALVVDAARAGDQPAVRKLIKEHANVNAPANDGSTALLWAAYHSDAEMTKALLAAGASVDAANHYGVTPLLQASRNGDVEVMKALLDAAEKIAAQSEKPEQKLRALTRIFVQLYVGAASRQRVLLNELENLTAEQRKIVVGIQHKLIHLVENIIAEVRPALSGRNPLGTPAAMLYFGMINWMHTWLDAGGRAKPARIADLTVNIFLDGVVSGDIPTQ